MYYLQDKVTLTAHRGYRQKFPENTMLAFREALKLDIDGIETDVRMTNDYQIVIMHDPNLDRTTDSHGHICDRSLAEVRQADAGIKFGEQFKGEKVPTLEELLELMKDRPDVRLVLELKDYPEEYGDFAYVSCEKSLQLCKQYGIWGKERLVIVCFSTGICSWIKKRYGQEVYIHGFYPKFKMKGYEKDEPYAYYDEVCLFNECKAQDGRLYWIKDFVVDELHFREFDLMGIRPCVYFSWDTNLEHYKTAYERGARGFTCDDPYECGIILDKIGARPLKKK